MVLPKKFIKLDLYGNLRFLNSYRCFYNVQTCNNMGKFKKNIKMSKSEIRRSRK